MDAEKGARFQALEWEKVHLESGCNGSASAADANKTVGGINKPVPGGFDAGISRLTDGCLSTRYPHNTLIRPGTCKTVPGEDGER